MPVKYHPWFRFEVPDAARWRQTPPLTADLPRKSLDSESDGSYLSEKGSWGSEVDYLEEHVDDPTFVEEMLRIDAERLWQDIHYSAQWGAIEDSMGMARLAASAEDGKARDWFVREARAIGCDVEVDQMGNIFAILPGLRSDIAPIAMGSHLDTQPAGMG